MQPLHYQLRLEPDLSTFTFKGRVTIRLNAAENIQQILLNSLELTVSSCKVQRKNQWVPCTYHTDPAAENLQIMLPEPMSGTIVLLIDYLGFINDKMAGFYRSAYTLEGITHYIAVTQFEESDARRAFPCMDHPRHKATFDIEIITDRKLRVISNEAVTGEENLANGKKAVHFLRTPKMSTYLLFLGVGEFETLRDDQDKRVVGAALPGRAGHLRFGVEFGRKSLRYCEDYFGIPYPLSKMHLIAVPDFAFGAMENWGAITFRENLLLHYQGVTSRSGAQRICEVIAHEIVHQWFGNLVTPSDWKYLWLNESFATYFGYGIVDHYYPQWGTWNQFLLGQTETAMSRDALKETFPIEIPGGEHVVINAGTAPIIYSKGGSLLRQIEGYIGKQNFQKGLRRYLKTHQYGCAESRHLWESFEAVSDRPVVDMVHRWIEQPGFPLIEARRVNGSLALSQKRFTYLPQNHETVWPIPITLDTFDANGKARRRVVLMESRTKTIDLQPGTAAFKLNAGQTGFYRVHYAETDDLKALGNLVERKAMEAEDRWGLQNDLFSLVRANLRPLDDYMKFLSYYHHETGDLPLSSIDENLFSAFLILDADRRPPIAEKGRYFALKSLNRIGWEPATGEPQTTAMLREQMIWHMAQFGHQDVLEFGVKQFDALVKGNTIHPDLAKSVMQIGAFTGDRTTFKWLCQRLETTLSEHERMNVLTALGCFRKSDLIKQAAQYTLDSVPARNKFIPLVSMAANPYATPFLWDWYIAHVPTLEKFHPLLYERVIAGIVPIAGMASPEGVRSFFKKYLRERVLAADVIRLSLEKLEINLSMKQAAG